MSIFEPHTVFFFEHQSAVPVMTFADRDTTVVNTHPVVLNANGTWPPIFFDSAEHGAQCDCIVRNQYGDVLFKLSPMGFGPFMWQKPIMWAAP